jgi:anti-anti-sigma factor
MELSLATRKIGDVVVFDISGRLCVGGALSVLRNAVKESLEDGNNRLVINLGEVSFIDSSGLGELITTHTSVQSRGGSINLLKPSSRIKELLKMTRLTGVLQSFDDEALAVQGLKG